MRSSVFRRFRIARWAMLCVALAACGPLDRVSGGEETTSAHPVDAGTGFVFAVEEKYSFDPVAIVEVDIVLAGEPSARRLVGAGVSPTRHHSGLIVQTEYCTDDRTNVVTYSFISSIGPSGTAEPLTPCGGEFGEPFEVPRFDRGRLSPDGTRLVAHLDTVGNPSAAMVFENGSLVDRFDGYHESAWIDDDTLVLVGEGVAAVDLGGEPTLVTDQIAGGLSSPDVSPGGDRIALAQGGAVWVVGTDGTGLREVLPAAGFVFPTWSPDGNWIAALQREELTTLDFIAVASPELVGPIDWDFVNLPRVTMVNLDNGELFHGDVTVHMTESQMPQGPLSWF